MTTTIIEPLNAQERADKARLESTITQSLETAENAFNVAKNALLEIHQRNLYREHGEFRDYIRKQWKAGQVSGSRRRQIWLALTTFIELSKALPSVSDRKTNERQMRALRQFPEEHRETIWQMAESTAKSINKPVSHGLIERTGQSVMNVINTGTTDGENPLTNNIIREEYEATQRQLQHITNSYPVKYDKVVNFADAYVIEVTETDTIIRVPGRYAVAAGDKGKTSFFVVAQVQEMAA